ncbi:MAG: hypothetical protein LBP86_01130 [Azoarcus sp.]|jgi:hypothetical protein|nr:hypothetical protein [Azoarcus sp.]
MRDAARRPIAPELLARCREDGEDAAILVAHCPVYRPCLALAARHLEAHGISTVLMGCARDVVEHCGTARTPRQAALVSIAPAPCSCALH